MLSWQSLRAARQYLLWATLALFCPAPSHASLNDIFESARALELDGRYELALDKYQSYLAGKPFSVNKRFAKTRLALLQKGLQADGDDGLAFYLQAMAAREQGNYKLALERLQTLLTKVPQSAFVADAEYLIGYIELMDRFDYAIALKQMQSVSASSSEQYFDTALYSQAIALEQLGRLDEARQAFISIRERHAMISSDFLGVHLARGNFKSRFWFSRATRRIESIDRFIEVERQHSPLGADYSLAIGARYHYDQPVGSGTHYRYIWNILDQHELPATHFTHWYTRSTDWRWESAGPLRAAVEAGLTPVISHWWFGDEISPQFVRDNRAAYLENINTRLLPILQSLPDAIVLLEPEFNKQGIEQWPEWDAVASEAILAIKRGAPHVRVGLVIGDWASFESDKTLSNIDGAVGHSDFVGFMLMTSAGNESADLNPVWSVRERAQRAAHALHQRWGKPLYFGYMALSSADNYRLRQAEYLRQLMQYAPMLASYGVFGAGYFSLLDNPRQRGWFGAAENHFGLLQADSADKPAAVAWRKAASDIIASDHTPPTIDSPLQLTAKADDNTHRLSAGFNEWVRWQVTLTGQQSGATRQFRGAGNRLSIDWHGEAQHGTFTSERVIASLQVEDKGHNVVRQSIQLQYHCARPCTATRPVTLDSDYAQSAGSRNGARSQTDVNGELQIELPVTHSAVTLPLPGKLSTHDRIRMQINPNQIAEGLSIGLIDEHHYQIDLPVEYFLYQREPGWQSINIAVAEFPTNARRFGRDGKQVQFGELRLNEATRLIIQQRLNTGTVAIRNLGIEQPANPSSLFISGVNDYADE